MGKDSISFKKGLQIMRFSPAAAKTSKQSTSITSPIYVKFTKSSTFIEVMPRKQL